MPPDGRDYRAGFDCFVAVETGCPHYPVTEFRKAHPGGAGRFGKQACLGESWDAVEFQRIRLSGRVDPEIYPPEAAATKSFESPHCEIAAAIRYIIINRRGRLRLLTSSSGYSVGYSGFGIANLS